MLHLELESSAYPKPNFALHIFVLCARIKYYKLWEFGVYWVACLFFDSAHLTCDAEALTR